MVKKLLLLACLAHLPLLAQAQNLSAFVDRNEVALNEIFTLTIRVNSVLGNVAPALTGLSRDFEQVGNVSTRTSFTSVNGNVESYVEYIVRLRPRATGTFTIPPFRVGGEVSIPISMTVGAARQSSSAGGQDIFLVSEVSKERVYVQEQLLYTIRLHYSISFDQGAQLTLPQAANAVVQQLGGDETYTEIINGIRYNVTERNFAIFPQSSGALSIAPVYFNATVGRRNNLNRFFNSRTNAREINLASAAHHVEVLSKPASYPSAAAWLPAADVAVEESWSGPLENIPVGESVTRNITIRAAGLGSSLLPVLDQEEAAGLKFYPDQPIQEDDADENGVISSRSSGVAIVPSEAGDFVLPAIEIPWWNTASDTLETAVIPSRVLRASLAPGNAQPAPLFVPLAEAPPNPAQASPVTVASQTSGLHLFWISGTALFAAAWGFSTLMWLRTRRRLAYAEGGSLPADDPRRNSSAGENPGADAALRTLKRACEEGNPKDIRRRVLNWAQALYQEASIITLQAIKARASSEELAVQLDKLDQALYGEAGEAGDFDANQVAQAAAQVHKERKKERDGHKKDYSLPPLYKN